MEFTFDENPRLLVFLPYIYAVWQDNAITSSEYRILKNHIAKQHWMQSPEKELVYTAIDSNNPPSRARLFHWSDQLRQHTGKHVKNLASLGLALANHSRESFTREETENIQGEFQDLALKLGLSEPELLASLRGEASTATHASVSRSAFDIKALTALLDGEEAHVIKKVKTIIASPPFGLKEVTDIAAYREKVMEWCQALADAGLGSYAYPKLAGGHNDMEGYFAIMETLSYHDLSLVIKFGVQFGLWGMSVLFLGTEKHHQKYLKHIGTLELPGCFAMTETHHGSNVKGIQTTANYDHAKRTFTINTPEKYARKEYIGNAANHGEMATVFAKLVIDGKDYGVNAFIVPIRDSEKKILPGITIEDCGHKMGLNGVDNGIITFDNVVIPKENMLDKFASVTEDGQFDSPIPSDNRRFFTMLGTLVGGRIGIPRSALAAAKTGLTIAIQYADKRKQFGPANGSEVPVLNYRMHQQRLIPYLANAYALHFGLQYLTKRFMARTPDDMQEIEALAAGMKAYGTWNTRDTLQECREACGGKGYLSENRIDALKNDTEIYTTFEGDNTVLMQLAAKNRLGEFRKQFGEMNISTVFNYLLDQAKTAVTEKNPIATRSTSEEHLKDPAFHKSAFEYREKQLTASAARRFKKLTDDGLDPFDAANILHPHMLAVGNAYIDRVVLEQFRFEVDAIQYPELKEIMEKLCQLFALNRLEQHKGWYLEEGYMEGVKTKAIRKMVSQLCWELRPDAVALTEAFAIPESCLAPIVTYKSSEA